MRLIRFLNHSNLFVAMATTALSAEAQMFLFRAVYFPLTITVFSSAWFGYSFLKRSHPLDLPLLKKATATLFVISLLWLSIPALVVLLVCGIIVLSYDPGVFLSGKTSYFSFRLHHYLKPVSIATCWTLVAVFLPIASVNGFAEKFEPTLLAFSLSIWLLVASLAIAGDLRDIEIDKPINFTLASKSGVVITKWVIYLALASSALLLIISTGLITTVITTYILIGGVLWFVLNNRFDWHLQTFVIEALLILQATSLMASQFL